MDGTREVVVDGDGLVTLCPDLGYYDRPAMAGRGGIYGAIEAPTNMQARDMWTGCHDLHDSCSVQEW